MNATKIEWVKNPDGTQGYTWNPITGCLNGCPYCYARKLANTRLRERYLANKNILLPMPNSPLQWWKGATPPDFPFYPEYHPFYPRFWEDRLSEVFDAKWKKPRGIFTCDMSDLFGIGIPLSWTLKVMDTIKRCPLDRFYLLTKQPQNLIKFSPFPDNCWVGVTATEYKQLASAFRMLSFIEAKIKYISFEPLLSSVTFPPEYLNVAGIKWVIIGSQTKPYKPPKWEWVSEIIDACVDAGIPYFLKNNLEAVVPKVFGGEGELKQEMPNRIPLGVGVKNDTG